MNNNHDNDNDKVLQVYELAYPFALGYTVAWLSSIYFFSSWWAIFLVTISGGWLLGATFIQINILIRELFK